VKQPWLVRTLALTTLACFGAVPAAGQKLTGPDLAASLPAPVALDTTGMFLARFVRVGDDVFIAGQPTERALRELRAQGVATVVNLRSPEEMTRSVTFDEAALVASLGMRYVHLPMRGTPEFPYAPEAVKAFAAAMRETDGKLLLHCTIAWRASHLWAAYLIEERKVPVATALEHARSVNLMDDHRMDGDRQPLEDFLGRAVPGLGHPRQP
jgi:uncharacterized protein (TIGR01244 family)